MSTHPCLFQGKKMMCGKTRNEWERKVEEKKVYFQKYNQNQRITYYKCKKLQFINSDRLKTAKS